MNIILEATYWDKEERESKTVIVEALPSILEDVVTRMPKTDRFYTEGEKIEFLIDGMTRPMLGRMVHTIRRVDGR